MHTTLGALGWLLILLSPSDPSIQRLGPPVTHTRARLTLAVSVLAFPGFQHALLLAP